MIKLEKLEKGDFFRDAFLVSYKYNKDYLNKMRSLKYRKYVPEKQAWEIPASELKHLVDLFGADNININPKYLEGLVAVSVWNTLNDPTTKGLGDSERAKSYTDPQ